MDQFARLLPYVWRNRSKVCLSIFFAVLVAALWAVTLSFTFLIVKVLLQGQSLDAYLAAEINESAARISHREQTLHDLEQDLEKLHSQESAVGTERGAQQRLITLRSCFGFIQSAIGTERGAQLQRSEDEIKRDQDHERRKLIAASQRLVALRWVQTYFMSWLPRDQFDTYALILGVLVLITILKGTAMFIQELLVSSVVELSVLALRKDCFRHALELDYQTLSLRGSSELMSRFTNDIGIAADGLNLLGGKIVREPLKALACIAAAFYVNWQLTLLSLVFVPLMAAVFHRYGQLLKRASHHMMERMSRIYKSLEETFDGLKIVIAFNGARRHRQRFHRENKEYYQKAMQVARIDALTSPTTELLGVFAVCVSLLPGAYLVLRHTDTIWGIKLTAETMEIGNLSLLYAYLAGVLDPVRKLSSVYAKLKRAAAATERVFEMMAWQPLLKQTEKAQTLPRHAQSICFKKVSFKYVSTADGIDRPPALNDVTLKVAAGEVIVVVGENGSGKSTLVNLLPRYYDPDLGAVLIDGIDIRNVRLRDLRSQIGVVTQETLLFDDTIFENIRYGKPDATHTEIVAAATKAHVLQLFDLLPEGFDTVVGPRGARLSGGQRQRVALARALLRDPSILILDEATSAVDAQSESMIHQCLGDFVKGRTVFLITHSVTPRLLEFATRIVVLEQGRLVATGSHDELLQSCAAYQRLYRAQTTGHVDDSCVDLPLEENSVKELTSDISAAGEIPLLIKFAPNATPEQTSHTAFDNSQHRDPRRKAN